MFDYQTVIDTLKSYTEVHIKFKKLDGTLRNMRCTLAPAYLPEEFRQQAGSTLTEGDGVSQRISVFDLDLEEWRSFRLESLQSMTVGH